MAATTVTGGAWRQLFDTHTLAHNRRTIVKITVSEQGDVARAVVDIDTLWRDAAGRAQLSLGRVGKVYAKVGANWTNSRDMASLRISGPESTHANAACTSWQQQWRCLMRSDAER